MANSQIENWSGKILAALVSAIVLASMAIAIGGGNAGAQAAPIVIASPVDGAVDVQLPVTISGTIQNPSSVSFATIMVTNSDGSYVGTFNKDIGFLLGNDGSWSISVSTNGFLPSSNQFSVEVYVEYDNGQIEQESSQFTAIIPDDEAPFVSAVVPSDGSVVTGSSVDVSAAVEDLQSGVDRVRIFVRKNSTGEYWNGSAWVTAWSWALASGDGAGNWVVPNVDASDTSTYRVLVWAWDVEGNMANWSDNPDPTFSTESSDTTPPSVSTVSPADGEIVVAGSVDVVAEVSDTESNVDRVRILVRDNTTGDYWDGFEWVDAWSWVLAVEDDPGEWSISNVDANAPGNYRVLVWAWDEADNLATWSANPSPTFSVASADSTPPEVLSIEPEDGADAFEGSVDVTAVVTDSESGVDRVRIMVRRAADNHYWNGSNWVPGWSWVLATPDGLGDAWVVPDVATEQSGTHSVLVWAWDEADNLANWSDNPLSQFQVNVIN